MALKVCNRCCVWPKAKLRRRDPHSRRRGMTLLELTLVMGVMAIILAVSWPLLDRPLAYERLRKAADLVIADWTSARVEAMRSGVHQRFRFQRETSGYELLSEEQSDSHELPEGIVFAGSTKSADSREDVESGGLQDAGKPEIWFYADGTSSDVPELILQNEYGMRIRLVLRGLTGVAEIDTDVPDADLASREAQQ